MTLRRPPHAHCKTSSANTRRSRSARGSRPARTRDAAVVGGHVGATASSHAGTSARSFARCFAATYGETPIRYLTRRRIERAQDLLRFANLTVTEVCMAVGFSSLGSFSSRFRELVGCSPREFQRRYAQGAPHIPGCYIFMRGLVERRNAIQEKPTTRRSG